jgi:hypothetical protein
VKNILVNIGGITMYIAQLSMIVSQSRVQQDASLAVMKIAINKGKETATQITEMLKNVAGDSNVGQFFDVRA